MKDIAKLVAYDSDGNVLFSSAGADGAETVKDDAGNVMKLEFQSTRTKDAKFRTVGVPLQDWDSAKAAQVKGRHFWCRYRLTCIQGMIHVNNISTRGRHEVEVTNLVKGARLATGESLTFDTFITLKGKVNGTESVGLKVWTREHGLILNVGCKIVNV